MLTVDMTFKINPEDPFTGTLYTSVYLRGIEVAWVEEPRELTEDTFYMVTNQPSVQPLFLKQNEGVIKLHWDRHTATDPVFAVYMKTTTENWWKVLQFIRDNKDVDAEVDPVKE